MTLYQVANMLAWTIQGFTKEDVKINEVFEEMRAWGVSPPPGGKRKVTYTWRGAKVTKFSERSYRYSAVYTITSGKHGPCLTVKLYHHEVAEDPSKGICEAVWAVPFEGII